jgi:DNA primase
LRGAAGTEARRYLEKRGLEREAELSFRLGYAPNSRSALKEHLGKAGFTTAEMITSGMLIAGDDIPLPYDRFRHRVMFPIADLKGRIVAFGGRALDPDQPAKYLNSPETPLFHKGHMLFNAHRARTAAHDKERVIAVEGYMDVVALSEAGFTETVAPLGTALTEDQIKLLWRMAPEPILCFDGDSAGRKAAFRAVDTLLPLLEPGRSMSFAFLPDGLDPDDLVRAQGAEAMESVFGRARPLIDVLFEREFASGDWSTPERRAGLEQQLRALVARIGDEGVRGHYRRDLAKRLDAAWGADVPRYQRRADAGNRGGPPSQPWRGQFADMRNAGGRGGAPYRGAGGTKGYRLPQPMRGNPSSSLRKSAMVAGDSAAPIGREALLIRALLNHPWLIEEYSETIAGLTFTSSAFSRLRDAILSAQALDNSLDREALHSHLSKSGVGKILTLVERTITHKCDKFAEPDAGRTEVEDGWRHALALHERHVGLKLSLEAAEQAWHEDRSEEAYARICELQHDLERLVGAETFDNAAGIDPGP